MEELERGLAAHREATLEMLDRSQNVEVLPIDYLGLLDDPSVAVEQLCSFLGADRLPAASQMAVAVKPNLYRERNESNGP